MPIRAEVIVSPREEQQLLEMQSAQLRSKIVARLRALATFPQLGVIDHTVPEDPHGMECRITYVSSFGIRYRFDPPTGTVLIDTITDERSHSYQRFL